MLKKKVDMSESTSRLVVVGWAAVAPLAGPPGLSLHPKNSLMDHPYMYIMADQRSMSRANGEWRIEKQNLEETKLPERKSIGSHCVIIVIPWEGWTE